MPHLRGQELVLVSSSLALALPGWQEGRTYLNCLFVIEEEWSRCLKIINSKREGWYKSHPSSRHQRTQGVMGRAPNCFWFKKNAITCQCTEPLVTGGLWALAPIGLVSIPAKWRIESAHIFQAFLLLPRSRRCVLGTLGLIDVHMHILFKLCVEFYRADFHLSSTLSFIEIK